jgi:hypothetical protein
MEQRYDNAPNDSPRSGIRNLTPALWGVILVAIVLVTIWFTATH